MLGYLTVFHPVHPAFLEYITAPGREICNNLVYPVLQLIGFNGCFQILGGILIHFQVFQMLAIHLKMLQVIQATVSDRLIEIGL